MSYATKDVSVQDSAPVLLFLITQGGTTWRLTTSSTTVSFLSVPWDPVAIVPGNFEQSGEMPKEVLTLKLPIDHAISATFLGYSPDVVTTVTVYRTHGDDLTNYIVYWKGRVAAATPSGNFMSLECEPVFSSLRRIGIREVYSRNCRHALFGAGCRLAAAGFAHAITVTAVAGAVLTITEAGGLDTLVGGMFKASDGTVRMITRHVGTTVTLMRPIKSLIAEMVANPGGFAATVYHGCDKTPETCRDVYLNLANFGGFPGIPELNPMAGNYVF